MKKRIFTLLVAGAIILSAIPAIPAAAAVTAASEGALTDFGGNCEHCGEKLTRLDFGNYTWVRPAGGGSGSGGGGTGSSSPPPPPPDTSLTAPHMWAGWHIVGSEWINETNRVSFSDFQAAKYFVLEVSNAMESPLIVMTRGSNLFEPEQVFDGQNTIMIPLRELDNRAEILSWGSIMTSQIFSINYRNTSMLAGLGITAAYLLLLHENCDGDKVYAPMITEQRGSWDNIFHLVTETRNAKIYYTLDGSTPSSLNAESATSSSLLYTERLTLPFERTTTIRAIAVKDGMEDSEILTATIIVGKRVMGGGGGGPAGGPGVNWAPDDTTPVPPPAPTPPLPEKPRELTTADALLILRYVAGLIDLTAEQRVLYDVNKDGEVNTADALGILRIVAGL
jgi:hypothetical protein